MIKETVGTIDASGKIQTRYDDGQFGPKLPADRIAAAQARREAMKAAEAEAHAEQLATDLEALADLEAEHGFDRVIRVDLRGWKPGSGATTMVVARIPLRREDAVKRFEQTAARSKQGSDDGLKALHTLAEFCIVYPHRKDHAEAYAATLDLAPGILSNVGLQVVQAVQGAAEEEKKG